VSICEHRLTQTRQCCDSEVFIKLDPSFGWTTSRLNTEQRHHSQITPHCTNYHIYLHVLLLWVADQFVCMLLGKLSMHTQTHIQSQKQAGRQLDSAPSPNLDDPQTMTYRLWLTPWPIDTDHDWLSDPQIYRRCKFWGVNFRG